ncbi:MAG: GNAT family N-acetyltransferase [Candidatus Woesearchaeota archaeon]
MPLKAADDTECVKQEVTEAMALDKILLMRLQGHDFWIARKGQDAAGYAVGILREEDYRSMGIYVSPGFRGRGIGSALKKAQIDSAAEMGCSETYSNVSEGNILR